jgi:dethiobiotin synthetase
VSPLPTGPARVSSLADLDRIVTGIVLVTGTGTGVGKTTVTAALAQRALTTGRRVVVVKPVQTADAHEPGDIAEIERMLGPGRADLRLHEFTRLPEPLAPQAAARRAGIRLPPLAEHARRIADLAADADLTLVEGAGGLLVRLDGDDGSGGTLADLAALLGALDAGPVGALVVTGAELGTLNVTELTVEALRRRGVRVLGLVIGSWPADPGTAEIGNLTDIPLLCGVPLLGAVPHMGAVPGNPALPPSVRDIALLSDR